MNTRQKSIKADKAEQDYVLRDAVKATPEEFPELCRIFSDMMKRKPCGRKLTLMVGKAHSAGVAVIQTRRTGVILIDRKEIPMMTEDEMRCLLGHELGHFFGAIKIENKPQPCNSLFNERFPRPLMYLFSYLSGQILADIYGVEQCRSTFIAGSHLSEGDSEMEALYSNPMEPLPEKFYTYFEVALRIKALGLLNKSEYFYELIGSELLGFGRWQLTTEEYFDKIGHIFDPYMNFTEDDGKALGVFLSGALFIAGCKVSDLSWRSELDLLGAFGDPGELLVYASTEAAYERIVAVAASIHGMSHPLKNIVWNTVWDLTYKDWEDSDEAERFDDFISKCERGQAVMPAGKHETCDEYIHCDGPYYADGFVYYDEIPETGTSVA